MSIVFFLIAAIGTILIGLLIQRWLRRRDLQKDFYITARETLGEKEYDRLKKKIEDDVKRKKTTSE